MASFSTFIGLGSFLSRISFTSLWIGCYYRTMKDSLLSIFEMNKKALIPKKEIYKKIIYYSMGFLYSISFDNSFNFIYLSGLLNTIFFLLILNMHLFIENNKNQMLIQSLFFFILIKIIYLLFNKYLISILFLCSALLVLHYPINRFRTGVLLNDKNFFDFENILVEIVLSVLWLIYSTTINYICFFFVCIINLFAWVCMLLGFQIVTGDISTNSKIYYFLINVFFIKTRVNTKIDNIIS